MPKRTPEKRERCTPDTHNKPARAKKARSSRTFANDALNPKCPLRTEISKDSRPRSALSVCTRIEDHPKRVEVAPMRPSPGQTYRSPSELRSNSQQVWSRHQFLLEFDQRWSKSAQCWPSTANIGRSQHNFGRNRSNCGRVRPDSAQDSSRPICRPVDQTRPMLAKLLSISANSEEIWPMSANFDRGRPRFGGVTAELGRCLSNHWPQAGRFQVFGRFRALPDLWPMSRNCGPNRARIGPGSAYVDRIWCKCGHIRSGFDNTLGNDVLKHRS